MTTYDNFFGAEGFQVLGYKYTGRSLTEWFETGSKSAISQVSETKTAFLASLYIIKELYRNRALVK